MKTKNPLFGFRFPIIFSLYFLFIELVWLYFHDYMVMREAIPPTVNIEFDHLYDMIFVFLNAVMMFILLLFYIKREKRHESELRSSEKSYRLLFEANPVPIVIYDIDTFEILETNKAANALYGYSADEFSHLKITQLRPEEDINKFVVYNVSANGQTASNAGVWRHLKKDGTLMHVEVFASTIFYKNRNVRIVQLRDVTDVIQANQTIQQSLKEKEILLQEVQHRVKNNLQVITSLLKLQLNNTKSDIVRQELQNSFNRIKTMSLTYERIYHSGTLSLIQVDSLIFSLINQIRMSQLLDPEIITFRTEITPVNSNVNFAVNLALIINEIVSNSILYAFPDHRKGEIYIRFYEESTNVYVMDIGDNGEGLKHNISLEEPETMGLQLVSSLVKQLSGKIEVCSSDGLHFRIFIPDKFNQIYQSGETQNRN